MWRVDFGGASKHGWFAYVEAAQHALDVAALVLNGAWRTVGCGSRFVDQVRDAALAGGADRGERAGCLLHVQRHCAAALEDRRDLGR